MISLSGDITSASQTERQWLAGMISVPEGVHCDIRDVTLTKNSPNCFVWCLANSTSPTVTASMVREGKNFCMEIVDVKTVALAIAKALHSRHPIRGWHWQPIEYQNPNENRGDRNPAPSPFKKRRGDFDDPSKYENQDEFRFAWAPQHPDAIPEYIDIQVPELTKLMREVSVAGL